MILTIAFPDTYVTSTRTFYDHFFKTIGVNRSNKYKAGHAALVLIEPTTGNLEYYDFGRYITPFGYGRIRSSETDPEIYFPLKAKFDSKGNLKNEEEIFLFLANSKFTHGEGRMIISVLKEVNYAKAKKFILKEQAKELIAYGPFTFNGSNCSRFVADAIIKGTHSRLVHLKTRFPLTLTPSPLGNTWNACSKGEIWEVWENEIRPYSTTRLKIWKELFLNFLDKNTEIETSKIGTLEEPIRPLHIPKNAQWLSGIGAGAWFVIHQKDEKNYIIERFDMTGKKDFSNPYQTTNEFSIEENYSFTYPSNAKKCHIIQNKELIIFEKQDS